MSKYLMLGKYTPEAIRGLSAQRTKKGIAIIKRCRGKVISMYALLGNFDLAFVVDFPGNSDCLKASVALTRLSGIGFTTYPAMAIEEFDRLAR